MIALSFAAAAFALAVQSAGMSPMPPADTYQATKIVCRSDPGSPIARAPVCRGGGGGPLSAQPACFCSGPDVRTEEPACWPDGTPATFAKGARPSGRDVDRMISCVDYDRQQAKHKPHH
jgi:hypothetical protein